MPKSVETRDRLQRPMKDLRISVIDRCNFRCTYCMPAEVFGSDYTFLPQQELLSFDEIVRVIPLFTKMGVEKIRITGGEPLIRTHLQDLIGRVKSIDGVREVTLTTNGVYLPRYAQQLRDAGLDRLNVSLDALDDEVFGRMNGRQVRSAEVLKGIEAAQKVGLPVKVNMVVKKGINDSELIPMAAHFRDTGIILRFIEFMDVGNANGWNWDSVVAKREIVERIHEVFPLQPADSNYYGEVADRFVYQDGQGEIGVISSVSESFCSTCTRARLSADGKLFTCLFAESGVDLRSQLRSDIGDDELLHTISSVWKARTDRYSDERSRTNTCQQRKSKIEMFYIGG